MLAASVVLGRPATARAEERDLEHDKAISVGIGPAMYLQQSSPVEAILGMKLRLGYAFPVVRPLRFSFDLGLTKGGWLAGSDVGTTVGTSDVAIEPTVGAVFEKRSRSGRAWLTGKFAVGPLIVWPSIAHFPVSIGALVRSTGGVRHLLSSSVAIGVDLSAAAAAGSFKLQPYRAATFMLGFDVALVVEVRI